MKCFQECFSVLSIYVVCRLYKMLTVLFKDDSWRRPSCLRHTPLPSLGWSESHTASRLFGWCWSSHSHGNSCRPRSPPKEAAKWRWVKVPALSHLLARVSQHNVTEVAAVLRCCHWRQLQHGSPISFVPCWASSTFLERGLLKPAQTTKTANIRKLTAFNKAEFFKTVQTYSQIKRHSCTPSNAWVCSKHPNETSCFTRMTDPTPDRSQLE